MYKTTNVGLPTPTANIAINRSRLKLYGKKSKVPTYYLQKGQEFQIELFNPTRDTILAKISLNGKPIAQGGLVLKPAQRVFLDRYIDVARKFKFDTYEVANTSESRAAIEENGDFRVEFFKEQTPAPRPYYHNLRGISGNLDVYGTCDSTTLGLMSINTTTGSNYSSDLSDSNITLTTNANTDSLNFMDVDYSRTVKGPRKTNPLRRINTEKKSKKTIETGRVEQGSHSDQTLTTVYMNWETYPFHTVEYKMLPTSQKVNTVADISVKRYCANCGSKNKPNFKFCPSCGTRV